MKTTTGQIELVETGNIARCLRRIYDRAKPYDSRRWKRALIHAISMSNVADGFEHEKKIREAIGLP